MGFSAEGSPVPGGAMLGGLWGGGTVWVEVLLVAALACTCACVLPMYLRLKRLDRAQAEYRGALAASGQALASAGAAVRGFSDEGRDLLDALALRIEEARTALAALEAGLAAAPAPPDASRPDPRRSDPKHFDPGQPRVSQDL